MKSALFCEPRVLIISDRVPCDDPNAIESSLDCLLDCCLPFLLDCSSSFGFWVVQITVQPAADLNIINEHCVRFTDLRLQNNKEKEESTDPTQDYRS